jgi:NADH:ubiquinone oxidoreductase subunit F (NADH-binding)/(2Fe-2S) ferredoxin
MSRILIGMGTCGLATGAGKVLEAARRWVAAREYRVEITPTGCLGYCQVEPIMDVVDDEGCRFSFGSVNPEEVGFILDETLVHRNYRIDGLLGQHRNGRPPLPGVPLLDEHPFFRKQVKFALRNCGIINPESIGEYRQAGGFQGLTRALGLTPQAVIDEIVSSGLRGRGGGGFSTGKKWQLAAQENAPRKFIICNADEGDPGAFMDRSLLEGDPFAVIEGMMIAGYAIGAREGVVYCRAEYPLAIQRLETAIGILVDEGLLERAPHPAGGRSEAAGGASAGAASCSAASRRCLAEAPRSARNEDACAVCGDGFCTASSGAFRFSLRIKKGAGAFVCGEETALMASIEGRRGMPRPRPPYPAASGLFGCPTVINNVETMANVSHIMREGAGAFSKYGTAGSKGTKVFALTGKIKNTGLVEVPMGITLREIIYDIGGGIDGDKRYKAVQIGGPAGGCIPEQFLDIRIDYESLKGVGAMMGSGGLVVMDEDTCMVDIARYFLSFTTKESCGKCIPCREGTQRMGEILEKITSPYSQMRSEEENLQRFNMVMNLENLANVIRSTSLCGLGQGAPNPVLSTLKYFRDEYEAHIYDRKCPARQCKGLLTYQIENDLCRGCTLCARKCPTGAIVGEPKKAHYILSEKCTRCGTCADVCKFAAVKVS